MKRNRPLALAMLGFVWLAEGNAEAEEPVHRLTVTVVGGKSEVGQVILSLFSSEENYLKHPVRSQIRPVGSMGNSVFVVNLPQGDYSVSAVYDENSNDKLDTGFLEIPKELVAFSNNAKGRFGPPKFEDTAIWLDSEMAIEIRLTTAKD